MSIPTEAVEAALLAMRGLNFYDYNDAGYIRAALEAAAPYIIAGHFRDMNLKAIANEIENPPNFSKGAP